MINRGLLLIVMLCSAVDISAQTDDRTRSPVPQSFITTIPIRDILRDYNIGYAHRLGEHYTLEARAGWVHPNRIVSKYYEMYLISTDWKFNGASFYLQLNKWKYITFLKKQRQVFYGWYAGYRYMYYIDAKMPLGGKDHSAQDEELTLSQWRDDILLFTTVGWRTSKFSTSELSIGFCVSFAHTHLVDTRFHPYATGTPEDENYRREQLDKVRGTQGFTMLPVIRFSSRVGYFNW